MITNNETLTRTYKDGLIEIMEHIARNYSAANKARYMKLIEDLKRDTIN